MPRARPHPPTAEPLAACVRQALAAGWRTLAELDRLTGARGASDARRAVHEALRVVRAEGAVLEERVGRAGVEVRLGPAPVPLHNAADDGPGVVVLIDDLPHPFGPPAPGAGEPIDAFSYYAGRASDTEDDAFEAWAAIQADIDAEPPCDPDNFEGLTGMRLCLGCEHPAHLHVGGPVGGQCLAQEGRGSECSCAAWVEPNARVAEPPTALDAPPPAAGQVPPVEAAGAPVAAREHTDPHSVECRRCKADPGHPCKGVEGQAPHAERAVDAEAWARVQDGLPPVVKGPGPGSRCARCGTTYDRHESLKTGHAFEPKPRGRPRAVAVVPPLAASEPGARAVYEALKAAGDACAVSVLVSAGNESAASVYAPEPDAARETRRMVPSAEAESETSRNTPAPRCPSVWHDLQCAREAGHPCGSVDEPGRHHETVDRGTIWTDEAAAGWARRVAEEQATSRGRWATPAPVVPPVSAPLCRPPACHRDDIIVPSAVRSFDRPLCAACREWVEGEGGSVRYKPEEKTV